MVTFLIAQYFTLKEDRFISGSDTFFILNFVEKPDRYVFFLFGRTKVAYAELDTSLSSILYYKIYTHNNIDFQISRWSVGFLEDSSGYNLILPVRTTIDSLYLSLMRFDTLGNLILWRAYNGQNTTKNYEYIPETAKILKLPYGYIITTLTDTFDTTDVRGFASETILILRLDTSGNVLWSKAWKWQDRELVISDAYVKDSNRITFFGWILDPYGTTHYDILLGEMDTSGNPIWIKTYQEVSLSSIRKVINLGSRILGILGHPLGWRVCGLIEFDTSFNILKFYRAGYENMYYREYYAFDGNMIYSTDCVIDTARRIVYPMKSLGIVPKGDKFIGIWGLYKGLLYRDTFRFCRGNYGYLTTSSLSLYPYDITSLIEVVPVNITPFDIPFYPSRDTLLLVNTCSRNIISVNETTPICNNSAQEKVYDISGRLLNEKNLPKGVYIIKRGDKTRKVIKK